MKKLEHPGLRWLFTWLLAGAVLAGARAGLVAYKDGYLLAGYERLAFTSFARHYSIGFVGLLLPIACASGAGHRLRGLARGIFFFVCAGFGYAFVSCRLPELGYHKPGFEGWTALAAHGVAGMLALAVSAWLIFAPVELPRAGKQLASLAILLTAAISPASKLVDQSQATWPGAPNVILISLDTLRTDHISAYGYERQTTPAIDKFAEQAMRFTRAHAPHPWTLTSHMSMFTGLSPREHGVSGTRGLANSTPTLAELYSEAGYDTLALVDSVVWLDQRFGFARGFASYRQVQGSARTKVEMLDQVLDDLADGPFFLFLHFFDAHSVEAGLPYDSDSEDYDRWCDWYEGEFVGGPDGLCASKFLGALNKGGAQIDTATERYITDLYDAGIRSMDRQLGALFLNFDQRGLFDNSIVILTADHGEELRDHGKFLHGTHFQECVSVPLLVRTPDAPMARSSDLLVSHVDMAATLLELSGLKAAPVGGNSYATQIVQGHAPNRHDHVFFDSGQGLPGVRQGDWKWIRGEKQFQLFNLATDPHEQHDLVNTNPPQLSLLRALSQGEFDRLHNKQLPAADPDHNVELNDEARRQLESLGYTGEQ